MSVDFSAEFQKLVVLTLRGDPGVSAIIADRVETSQPASARFPYISIGASDTLPDDAACIDAQIETLQLDCWSRQQGNNIECKRLVSAVKRALHWAGDGGGIMAPANVDFLYVNSIRVLEDPDGITGHGIVSVQARLWEDIKLG